MGERSASVRRSFLATPDRNNDGTRATDDGEKEKEGSDESRWRKDDERGSEIGKGLTADQRPSAF